MKPLSTQLFRMTMLAALAAVVAIVAFLLLSETILDHYISQQLSPALRDEFMSDQPLSPELLARLEKLEQELPTAEIMNWSTIGSALIGLIVAGMVGFYRARDFIPTFAGLAHAAQHIRQGDFSVRAPAGLSKINEVESFVNDFNAMATEIERADLVQRENSAAIAHELRTPLTILNGRLNGLLDDVFPLNKANLQILLTQVELLGRIVEDLRLLSLARAGQLSLNYSEIDLAGETQQVLEAMAPLFSAQGLSIEAHLTPVFLPVDPARLRQALQALLNNAVCYGKHGITVAINTDNNNIYLHVMDKGPGLSPEQAKRAFEPFWRAESSRDRHYGGSGLGLSVVQAIALAHGGQISYQQRDGGGAIFTLLLPRHQPPSTQSTQNPHRF